MDRSKFSDSDIDHSSVCVCGKQVVHLKSYLIQKWLAGSILMGSSRCSATSIDGSSVYFNVDESTLTIAERREIQRIREEVANRVYRSSHQGRGVGLSVKSRGL